MLRKAEHIGIEVSDMDRSIKWYTEVLGLTVRQHGVELIHQQPVYAERLKSRIAFFRGPDGEKLELFEPNVTL